METSSMERIGKGFFPYIESYQVSNDQGMRHYDLSGCIADRVGIRKLATP